MLIEIIMHTFSAYSSALHDIFYIIDLVSEHMYIREWNEKHGARMFYGFGQNLQYEGRSYCGGWVAHKIDDVEAVV